MIRLEPRLQETRSIHDFMKRPNIKFIAYTRGDQKVRGKVLLNHIAYTDFNENHEYTVRHELSIAPIVSLKNEGSFPVMNIFLFYLLE